MRKTKKGSNAIRGWSVEGKRYVCMMMIKINGDEQSGIHKKWESMYRKLCAVARQVDEDGRDDKEDETFEVDEAMLYTKI